MRYTILLFFCLGCTFFSQAQYQFSEADTLRGMLRPERTCYDVTFYDLNIALDIEQQTLSGYNRMDYKVLRGFNMLQIDLFKEMEIDSIVHQEKKLEYHRKHNAVFVDFGSMQERDTQGSIIIYYHGKPLKAINAPWDGGFSWKRDKKGEHWIGVSCEGIGASLWWPNKDHLSDEPDSMRIRCKIPSRLSCVANGVLRDTIQEDSSTTYDWFVSYPINNYNVTLNIANYVHFSDTFVSPTDGSKLPLDYYVLPYNLKKAKKQFRQVQDVLKVFEKYFDKYPFWNDGYALVETPYLGMEHQGAIAYGNQYMDGYMGGHPSGIPVDFIILHETGHEWWGNSISCNDHAEMWLHETFTTYMESIYVEEMYSFDDAVRYLKHYSAYIANRKPIVGPKDVNFDKHDSDMYYKGAVMLHTLRKAIGDDDLWWKILKTFYQKNTIQNVNTEDFVSYVNKQSGQNFDYFFQQYLHHPSIPKFEYKLKEKGNQLQVTYRWNANVEGFKMPITFQLNGKEQRLIPQHKKWQKATFPKAKAEDFKVNFGLYRVSDLTD